MNCATFKKIIPVLLVVIPLFVVRALPQESVLKLELCFQCSGFFLLDSSVKAK